MKMNGNIAMSAWQETAAHLERLGLRPEAARSARTRAVRVRTTVDDMTHTWDAWAYLLLLAGALVPLVQLLGRL